MSRDLNPGRRLMDNDTAGDAVSGVTRGIAGQVVRLGMDDQRSTALVEKRMWTFAYRDACRSEREFAGSLL